jgi:hypothetical protein
LEGAVEANFRRRRDVVFGTAGQIEFHVSEEEDRMKRNLVLFIAGLLVCAVAFAQGTGSINGTVTLDDGSTVPGVMVEASADVLPQARMATTAGDGGYRFRQLPPGNFTLTFSLDGMGTEIRTIQVRLDEAYKIDITMGPEAVTETIDVISTSVIDLTSSELKTAISDEVINQVPTGQEYRDLLKLIPGVQYSEDSTRGPSAGGSGQDNVYLFDGANVAMPLFGNLSAEPSSHDIADISIVKGGAKAIDFNRSGGFTINSVSKSGTNLWRGDLQYQFQTDGMTGNRDTTNASEFERDLDWTTLSAGGPLASERLFFYGSYYRPTVDRANRSNFYGEVPDLSVERDELYGKLTFTPSGSVTVHASYRDSDSAATGASVLGEADAGTTSEGGAGTLGIATLDVSWVIDDQSFANFRYSDFENETSSRPDNLFTFGIGLGQSLDIANLDSQGLFVVPQPIAGLDTYNAFIAPIISQYGYVEGGVATGGGTVGGGSTIDDQDFFRNGWEISYDRFFGRHEVHVGYQTSTEEEDLSRTSNGWGVISVPSARTFDGQQVFYEARFEQMGLAGGGIDPVIHSEYEAQSFEINDVIRLDEWTINLGLVAHNDELFGQGLRANSSNVSGFELAPGNIYSMYEVDFGDTLSPRVGATWSYNGKDTLYANYAKYYPAANSLPRAASWARNLRRSIRAYFDAAGNYIGTDPVRSSSGKFFQPNMDPRSIDEYLIGTSKQFNNSWTGHAHFRYRKGQDFWEDTNNNARSRFEPPPGIPTGDYIPELDDYRAEVGGSSYVIAQLDGAFTKYYEASFEGEWRGENAWMRGSYVWSHYYGNFDQDNTTTSNDANTFIGSSFLADGAGRQLWDNRYGDLRGDRRHQLKLYGFYNFNWDATGGFFAVYQSGQPWEAWNVEVYRHLTGSSSDTSRYAEPAGSRTTSDHYQIDLNYTHWWDVGENFTVQARADLFNVLDEQTGYNIQNKVNSSGFGDPRSFFDPRRLQLAVKLGWR